MLLVMAVALALGAFADDGRELLRQMEAQRAALQTGKLELYVDAPENRAGARSRFKSIQFAGTQTIVIDRGDEHGVALRTIDGESRQGKGPGRFVCELYGEDGKWLTFGDPLGPTVLRTYVDDRFDARTIGIAPSWVFAPLEDQLWKPGSPNPVAWKYDTTQEGDLVRVTVRKSRGTTTYWLAPEQGHQAVRVRHERDDGVWLESRSELRECDGIWFPAQTEYFRSTYESGRKPSRTVRVAHAEFNEPEHPTKLTARMLYLDVGSSVQVHETPQQHKGIMRVWNGEKVITQEEFANGFKNGTYRYGAAYMRGLEKLRVKHEHRLVQEHAPATWGVWSQNALREMAEPSRRGYATLWREYTQNFIQHFALDEEQTQRARLILEDAEARAQRYIDARRVEFTAIDDRASALARAQAAANRSGEPDHKSTNDSVARIAERRAELLQPIQDIFEKFLKPRLDTLPTRAQRRVADARPSPRAPASP